MTTPSTEASTTDEAAPAAPARPARRGPADLPFAFADLGLAKALADERSEPDWLAAERLAALASHDALPVEANRLYTPYVDLRAADLFGVRPYVRTAAAPAPEAIDARAEVPADTAGLIELREDGVVALALAPDVTAAGVTLETFAAGDANSATDFAQGGSEPAKARGRAAAGNTVFAS